MFGDNYMLDVIEASVDVQKSRIPLPKFVNADAHESVVLLEKTDFIEVWSINTLKEKLRELERLILCAVNDDDRARYQFLSDQFTSVAKTVKVSSNWSRITVGKKLLDKYQIVDKVIVEGKGDYIRLWEPNKFDEYKMNINRGSKGLL